MKREEVQQLVDRGLRELHQALAGGNSERLEQYLKVMAQFPNYSFNNIVLIWSQFPEAQMVLGFHSWKKLGRKVKKGEKGIGIVAPLVGRKKDEAGNQVGNQDGDKSVFGFRVVHVFDVSQTEGEALPKLGEITGDPGTHIGAIEKLIANEGIELTYEPIKSGALGVSKNGQIVVQPDLEPPSRMATLVHELAHEKMHKTIERRRQTNQSIRETEAEAVAHIVCQALGMESIAHSADYIRLYDGDVGVLNDSMTHIQRAASEILTGIQAHHEVDIEEAAA